jgi:hypothetical protein|tara:strand:+ start:39 stop:533 length:495 start_codon:yes stop_codon:yes gene_type:complete
MSSNITKNTAKSMINKSRQRLKEIVKKLKSGAPKTGQDKLVQEYGIEHTKIIGWQNRYFVFEECQSNGPADLIFIKINVEGKLVQFNIDAKGIHPNCKYFPAGKRRPTKKDFEKRNKLYQRIQSISWRVEDKDFTHETKKFTKGFIIFKDANNKDVTRWIKKKH